MKNQKGFSLIEIVIAIGFIGFIGLLITTINTEVIKGDKRASENTSIHADLVIQENAFSSLINTFDLRMTFTGPGLSFPSNTYESRFLIPLPKTCRDLTEIGCENDTSLMFANYRKKYSPAVEMHCSFNYPNAAFTVPLTGYSNARIFVFAENLDKFGPHSISESPSKIKTSGVPDTYYAGDISLDEDDIFVVQDGAYGSLWRVVKGLKKLPPPPSAPPLVSWLKRALRRAQVGPECYTSLEMNTNEHVYYLYAVPLKPNYLTTNYHTDLKSFNPSYKIMNAEILTIGRNNSDGSFGVNKCKIDPSSEKIICPEHFPFPSLKDVSMVRMDEEFKLPLKPETITKWYDVGKACTHPSGCGLGEVDLLNVPNIPKGLVQNLSLPLTPGLPTFEKPNTAILLEKEFSFYKQDFLHRIRFRIKQKDKRRDIFVRFF